MTTARKSHPQDSVARETAQRLKAEFFRTLGHPLRLRVIGLLKDGEKTVGQLQAELGIDSSGASQHLAAMRRAGILEARKEGTSVHYSVRDPRVFQVMESARQVIGSHLEEANSLLGELEEEDAPGEGASTTRSRSR
jgi:ArsR family transcriptional regulator